MIVLSNSESQSIDTGGTVTFDTTVLHTGCHSDGRGGAEHHRDGSGTVQLRPGIYEIAFHGNVSSTIAGTSVQLAIAFNKTPILETTMIQTIGTANTFENIATSTYIRVCRDTNATIFVENTGTSTLTLAPNPGLNIRRVA